LNLLILELLPFEGFSRVFILPAWIRVNKLVIPGGIPFLGWIYCPWTSNSQRKTHSYGGFYVYEQVIPADSLFIPWRASVGSPLMKFLRWISRLCAGNSRQNHYFSRGGRVLAVRGRKILRMVTIPRFLIQKDLYRVSIIFKN
jgi:hypothetical protein